MKHSLLIFGFLSLFLAGFAQDQSVRRLTVKDRITLGGLPIKGIVTDMGGDSTSADKVPSVSAVADWIATHGGIGGFSDSSLFATLYRLDTAKKNIRSLITGLPAYGITNTNISNWNTAYGWGSHAGLYPVTNRFLDSMAAHLGLINSKLSSVDTGNIANFFLKVRSLFSGIAPVSINNGQFGVANATRLFSGLMTAADKARLDSNGYVVNVGDGYKIGYRKNDSTWAQKSFKITGGTIDDKDTTLVINVAPAEGFVPSGTSGQLIRGNGTYVTADKNAVGLGNVDNTSDANKPISSATQGALNAKANTNDLADVATSGSYGDLSDKPGNATSSTDGFMSAADKQRLDSNFYSLNMGDGAPILRKINENNTGLRSIKVVSGGSAVYNDTTIRITINPAGITNITEITNRSYNDLQDKPTIPAQVNLIEGAGIDITGSYPNLTIAATGGGGGASTLEELTDVDSVIAFDLDVTPQGGILAMRNDTAFAYTPGWGLDTTNKTLRADTTKLVTQYDLAQAVLSAGSYTDEQAQDAVGTALSSEFTYNDAANSINVNAIAQSKVTGLASALDGKQPLDADLTAIAGITAANNDFIQRKTGAWTNRTPAQVKADLALVKADVGLGSVEDVALSGWSGSTNIASVGTVNTGSWNATPIASSKGGLPTGGSIGQILKKNSGTNYDVSWAGESDDVFMASPASGITGDNITSWNAAAAANIISVQLVDADNYSVAATIRHVIVKRSTATGDKTVTLPSAASYTNRVITVVNQAFQNVLLSSASGNIIAVANDIDPSSGLSHNPQMEYRVDYLTGTGGSRTNNSTVTVVSDGTHWRVIDGHDYHTVCIGCL